MAKSKSIQVVFYKDSELDNGASAPYYGWLYPAGVSLKGQQPTLFETEEALVEAINAFKEKGIEKLYFNSIPKERAVRTY